MDGEEVEGERDADGRVRITTRGSLLEVGPRAGARERIGLEELREIAAQVEMPGAFRPDWLGLQFAPRLRPHYLNGLGGGIRPLIFEQTAMMFPFATIGKVFIQRRGQQTKVGSGVLVGPRLLLMASHAMPWENDDSSVRFVPAYKDGNDPRFGHAYVDVWRGVPNDDDVTGLDYVICKLNWRTGERTGWLGSWWSPRESFYYDREWLSVGYPSTFLGGQRQAIEVPVGVRDIDNDGDGLEIETHKFALGGWSGGPLWGGVEGQFRVVGIESGYEKDFLDPERTVFAGGEHMVNLVKYGWANWA
ncbi:MAG: hypothetical protein ABWY20_12510 [Mycobacterium sp.]